MQRASKTATPSEATDVAKKDLHDIIEYRDGTLFWKTGRKGSVAGTITDRGYCRIKLFGKLVRAHHIVWYLHHGYWPKMLDHEDRNPANNRIENLRECSRSENGRNQGVYRVNNTSGFRGVYCRKSTQKWHAQITVDGKKVYLGAFNTPQDAATVYNFAATELHGAFASLNSVPQPWLNGGDSV